MNKKINIITSGILLVFIFGMLLWLLLTPSKTFSQMENRPLAQAPQITLQGIFSGDFMSDFETYLTDQFPIRDSWVGLKYLAQRGLLKTENNGVYFGSGGMLLQNFPTPNADRLNTNFGAVQQLADNTDIPVRFTLVPTSTFIYADRLPKYAPTYDQTLLLQQAQQFGGYFDVTDTLLQHRGEYIYYRTDHHWTTLGAYYAYLQYCQAAGLTPVELPEGKILEGFLGTTLSTAGARFMEPDFITYYDFGNMTAEDHEGNEIKIYNEEFFDVKDKYSMFFSGNQPLMILRNTDLPEGDTLVLVRDSFSDSILPFLSQHYSEIHVVDPRYNKQSVSAYAEEIGADEILVLFQTGNFATESSIVFIK